MTSEKSLRLLLPKESRHCLVSQFVCLVAALGLVLILGCNRTTSRTSASSADSEWHPFSGIWTASGSRNTLRLQGDRRASVSDFSGSLVLAGPSKPGIGFRSEAVVFSDSSTGLVGRAVWTDEHGDQVFSELRADGTSGHDKITGTFLGGTGRYAGATGTYEFSWRFMLANEEGLVQGQSLGLTGKVKAESSRMALRTGGPEL